MTRQRHHTPADDAGPIRVGVSACLLGEPVRFDGGHKRDRFVSDVLAEHFELVPVCPEAAIGLGTPREPVRLVARDSAVRVVGTRDSSRDVTDALAAYGRSMAGRLDGLSGYIFKSKSPSCGLERVKVYRDNGAPASRDGRGGYADAFLRAHPLLPAEEEGRLNDPALRESFLTRVLVYHRWQRMRAEGLTPAALVAFHTEHKYLLLAHDPDAYGRLGRRVARAGSDPLDELAEVYVTELMRGLERRATRKRHVNVLEHLSGYLREQLDTDDRAELHGAIRRYREGRVPLIVPMTLMAHHFRHHPDPFIARQHYLEPYPDALGVRNAV